MDSKDFEEKLRKIHEESEEAATKEIEAVQAERALQEKKRLEEEEERNKKEAQMKAEEEEKRRLEQTARREKWVSLVREALTSDREELEQMYYLKPDIGPQDSGDLAKTNVKIFNKPISLREAILCRLTGKPHKLHERYIYPGMYDPHDMATLSYSIERLDSEEVSPEERKLAEVEADKRRKIRELVTSSDAQELDEDGKIILEYPQMPYREDYSLDNVDTWLTDAKYLTIGQAAGLGEHVQIEIPITKRELMMHGLDPELLGWKSMEQIRAEKQAKEEESHIISGSDIAEADKEYAITTEESNGIKGFFNRLKNKIKGLLKGQSR